MCLPLSQPDRSRRQRFRRARSGERAVKVKVFLIKSGATKTGILPRREQCATPGSPNGRTSSGYRPALAAIERAFEKSGSDDTEITVRAVMAALSSRGAKLKAVVGEGTGMFAHMSRLSTKVFGQVSTATCNNALSLRSHDWPAFALVAVSGGHVLTVYF
jgi:hypothetical protein